MDSFKNASRNNQIAAVLFALLSVHQLTGLFRNFTVFNLLWVAGYVVVTVSLFLNKRDILPVVGFGVLALSSLRGLLSVFDSYFSFFENLMMFMTSFVGFASFALMLLFAVAVFTNAMPQLRQTTAGLWFVPAILVVVSALVTPLVYSIVFGFSILGSSFLWNVFRAAAFLFAALWIMDVDCMPWEYRPANTAPAGRPGSATYYGSAEYGEGYCGLVKHILLLLFTFGIWSLIWIYRTTRYLNCVEDEEQRNPTAQLLLCMFVPFYVIFWTYKSAQRIDKLAAGRGIPSDISMLCLILAIFVGVVPFILMQDKMNAIVTGGVRPQAAPAASRTAVHTAAPAVQEYGDGYCDLVKHILLLVFTFGIWSYIWIYRTTRYLNCVEDEQPRDPTSQLLLCMFVPFYAIFWIYQSAQRIDKLAGQKGIPSDITMLCLILAIFVGIVPLIMMQDKMNAIATSGSRPQVATRTVPVREAPVQQPVYTAPVQEPVRQEPVHTEPVPQEPVRTATRSISPEIIQELRLYKELLDMDIITKEEFQEKKKQLLG